MLVSRGHEWVGLVGRYNGTKPESKQILGIKNKKWWVVSISKDYISKNFTNIKKYKNPNVAGKDLVDEIKKIIDKEQPDVVFINGSSAFAWAYLKAAYSAGIPIIALHAGMWGAEIDIYSDLFTSSGIKVLKKMEKDFAVIPNCNVFLNETSRDYFTKYIHNIPAGKTQIIPLPCESSSINIKPKLKTNKVTNIGIVARWDRIKNHGAFLNIAKTAVKHQKKWNFFAVTKIPETNSNKEFKENYRKLIKEVTPMEQSELRKFYRKMDFMILPSFFDVSPHVVLEAALEGVPTFISKNVGYAKLFKTNGMKDFIINFSDPVKAFKKIEAMESKKYRLSFTKLLKKTHDPETVLNKFEILFKKTIKQ